MDYLVGQPALQHAVDEAGEIRVQTLTHVNTLLREWWLVVVYLPL